ncbi:MAG: arylsulfatase [Flavobacterium sp.]|nr:arylsulfatase [Flavobacterium sp.]
MLRVLMMVVVVACSSICGLSQTKQPNIIFLLADDLGYGDIGCYGQQKIETPNINQLAKEGLRATQFYSASPVCAPARTSFMTGLHTGHTPVRGNKTIGAEGQTPLPNSTITFAMLLQQNGYNTAAFGKWGLGFIGTSGEPAKKGIEEFYGYNCQTQAHNYYPNHLWYNSTKINFTNNPQEHHVYSADDIHNKALDYLQQQGKQPFFMYLPYTLPHGDLSVPHDSLYNYYVAKFAEAPLPKPTNYKAKEGKWFEPYPHAAFAAMVARLDKFVGDINKVLKQKALEKNTIFIFTSDNGPHKEDGGDPAFFNSTNGYRGIKRDVYEGGIRVPFIAKWKSHIKPNTKSNFAFALYDMFPTFLDVAKAKNKQTIDGISVLPTLLGKPQAQHNYLYWELSEAGSKQAIRVGNWKAVKLNVSTNSNATIELYNLKLDPFEKNNIAAKQPAIATKLDSLLQKAHVYNKDWPILKTEF